jgi:FkbM family methyltransferase
MYLENLIPSGIAALFSPGCFVKRLMYPDLVSFGLLANLHALGKRGVFKEVDAIVDVGANVGQFAFMAHTALPHLPIFSFEPDPSCFEGLQQTFATHHINGKCFPLAISDQAGQVQLNVYESTVNNSLLHRQHENTVAVKNVNCATLDSLRAELFSLNTLFLKIDVQGAELSVLRGAGEFLKRCKFVLLEVSLVSSYDGNAHIAEVLTAMRSAGFSCLEIVDVLRKKKPDELGIAEMDLLFIRNGATDAD